MAYRRDPRAVRRLDLSKYAVLLVLAVTLIVLLTTRSCQPQLTVLKPTPAATLAPTFTAEATLARPVLVSPLTGSTVAPGAVALRGVGARGYSIRVRDHAGKLLAATHVQPDASWTTTATIDAPGDVALTLELVNAAGDVIAAAAPLTLTVGVPAVAIRAPALDQTLLDATLSAGRLELRGSGEPGAAVEVVIDGIVTANTVVDAAGRWEVALQANAPGVYAIGLQTRDAAGLIVATATPAILSITAPPQPVVAVPPTATATPDQTPPAVVDSIIVTMDPANSRIAADGKGAVGAVVELLLDATVVATTTIGETGAWALLAPLSQPDAYTVNVRAVDPVNGAIFELAPPPQGVVVTLPSPTPTDTPLPAEDVVTEEVVTLTPTDTATVAPTATETVTATSAPTDTPLPTETATSEPTDTATPEPTATATASQTATTFLTATDTATPMLDPPAVDTPQADRSGLDRAALPLTGSGTPGDVVRVVVDGAAMGTTVVDAQGRWQILVEVVEAGAYSITVESIDLGGNVRAAAAPISVDIPAPTKTPVPTGTNTATPIPTSTATDTATETPVPTNTNTATPIPTDTASAVELEAASVFTNTATPIPTDTATPIPTSTATATPIPMDTATPVPTSTATDTPVPTSTNTATPIPPVIDVLPSVRNGVGDQPLRLTGRGTPGDTVRAVVDGVAIVTAVVDAAGRWQLPIALTEGGAYSITVESSDVRGAVRTAAEPVTVEIATMTSVPTAAPIATDTATPPPTSTRTATAAPTDTATLQPTHTATSVPMNTATPTIVTEVATAAASPATSTPTATPAPTDTAANTATPLLTHAATSMPLATTSPLSAHTATAALTNITSPVSTDTPAPTATHNGAAASVTAASDSSAEAPDRAAPASSVAALPPTGIDFNGAPVGWAVFGALALVGLLMLFDRRHR